MICEPIAWNLSAEGRSGDLTEINSIGVKYNYVKLHNQLAFWKVH